MGATTFALTVAASCTTVGASAATVAFTSVIPDQLPPERRGPASAVVGLSLPVGAVLGLFIAQLVAPDLPAMILLPAGFAVLGTLLLAVTMRDRRLPVTERPAFAWRDLPRTFWVNPVRHPNFGYTWLSRLLIFFGIAAIQATSRRPASRTRSSCRRSSSPARPCCSLPWRASSPTAPGGASRSSSRRR